MRTCWILSIVASAVLPWHVVAQSPPTTRFNPVIELLEQKQPVFGLYAPSNRRGRGAEVQPAKTAAQLAREALEYRASDFIFDGTMEGNFERGFPTFAEFAVAFWEAAALQKARSARLTHPLIVKMHEIAPDPKLAAQHIGQQLNLGVSGIVFVGVESAEEVRTGLAAMRFAAQGGTRPEAVDRAPAYWGMSEAEYRQKADLWPLNPRGELINWTIVESRAGLARVREIAAVKGIGVLFPGAGTLRGLFTSTDANGQRVFDEKAWEAAIQQVLAACKEFNVPCGYPANANDIEMRMKQGFSVFIMNWGEAGFQTIDIGRRASGRPAASGGQF
jgi:4-hydroxy-2-oxoheptanedioate aldolase